MSTFIILAQSKATAKGLELWRDTLLSSGLGPSDSSPSPPSIIIEDFSTINDGEAFLYEHLIQYIEQQAGYSDNNLDLSDVCVLVDAVSPNHLDAASERINWDSMVATLILVFPEVRWGFGTMSGDANQKHGSFPYSNHSLESIRRPRRSPIMDPSGLRTWVINVTAANLAEAQLQPKRSLCAAIIEDEREFAFLHGYTSYRFGFRVDIITSWSLLKDLMHDASGLIKTNPYQLIMEDMRLQYADKPSAVRLDKLADRDEIAELALLNKPMNKEGYGRYIVTTGRNGIDNNLYRENCTYLKNNEKLFNHKSGVLLKPVGGILDIWRSLNFLNASSGETQRAGNVRGFSWPPSPAPIKVTIGDNSSGHSAQGRLGAIAGVLLRRANIALSRSSSSIDYICAAVLACGASELLSTKNPTSSLTALAVRHEAEVRAECAFIGSGYHIDLRSRLAEIKLESDAICSWFDKRQEASLDAQVFLLNRLVLALRDAGRFDEENQCMVALRKANRKLQWKRSNVWGKISLQLLLGYTEWLISDVRWLVGAALVQVAILWSLTSLHTYTNPPNTNGGMQPVSMAVGAFFGGQTPPYDAKLWFHLAVAIGVISGVYHIGVLISYIYTVVSRR